MDHSLPVAVVDQRRADCVVCLLRRATYIPNVVFGLLTAFVFVMALLADLLITPALLLTGRASANPVESRIG